MLHHSNRPSTPFLPALVRWIARIGSAAVILLVGAFLFGGEESMVPTPKEAVGMLLFPVGVVAGFVIAWWREAMGGLISLASLAAFNAWIFLSFGRFPGGPYFLILSSPAFLFLLSALLRRTRPA